MLLLSDSWNFICLSSNFFQLPLFFSLSRLSQHPFMLHLISVFDFISSSFMIRLLFPQDTRQYYPFTILSWTPFSLNQLFSHLWTLSLSAFHPIFSWLTYLSFCNILLFLLTFSVLSHLLLSSLFWKNLLDHKAIAFQLLANL